MDVGPAFVANAQAAKPVQPAERSFHDPAPLSQPFARFDASTRNPWRDAAPAKPLPVASEVIALVGMQFVRPTAGSSRQSGHDWQRLHKRLQHARIVNVSSRYLRYQWEAPLVDDDVMLAAELAAIGRVWSRIPAAQGGMARWLNQCWRAPIRSDRTPAIDTALRRAGAARRQPAATHEDGANNSCRCRNQVPAEDTPKASQCAGQTKFQSAQHGHSGADGRPLETAYVQEGSAQ